MTLADLIRRVRVAADDLRVPYLWRTENITDWLNDGEAEAAIRARLLRATPSTASSLCEVAFSANVAEREMDPALFEISHQTWRPLNGARSSPLCLVSREWIDGHRPDWRDLDPDDPQFLVRDANLLRLVPAPGVGGALLLEGYRLPLRQMVNDDDTPEIGGVHHIHLVQWALYKGYSIPDTETYDPNRAARAESEFSRYFGPRPDADLRHAGRADEPHHNIAW